MTTPNALFAGTRCSELLFSISVNRDRVRLAELSQAIKWDFDKIPFAATRCSPKQEDSDFHIHARWLVRKEEFVTRIEFAQGSTVADENETEPWAEDFMQWLTQFLPAGPLKSYIGADFEYPAKSYQCRFPLPMTAAVGPNGENAQIEGLTFTVPSKPEGIETFWLTLRSNELSIHIAGSREIDLSKFDPRNEIAVYSGVLESVLEKKS